MPPKRSRQAGQGTERAAKSAKSDGKIPGDEAVAVADIEDFKFEPAEVEQASSRRRHSPATCGCI